MSDEARRMALALMGSGYVGGEDAAEAPRRDPWAELLMSLREKIPENRETRLSALNMLLGAMDAGANTLDTVAGYRDPSQMTALDAPGLAALLMRTPGRVAARAPSSDSLYGGVMRRDVPPTPEPEWSRRAFAPQQGADEPLFDGIRRVAPPETVADVPATRRVFDIPPESPAPTRRRGGRREEIRLLGDANRYGNDVISPQDELWARALARIDAGEPLPTRSRQNERELRMLLDKKGLTGPEARAYAEMLRAQGMRLAVPGAAIGGASFGFGEPMNALLGE